MFSNFVNLLDNVTSHLTEDELQEEKWMHQFNHEIRQYPITNSLVELIHDKLDELTLSPEDFVKIINENRGLEGIEISEPNKLQIEIIDMGNGDYRIFSSIRFELPLDFIDKILSKKTTTISYINMEGILFNLFLSEGKTLEEAHKETDDLLFKNKFYTIKERNELIRKSLKEKTDNNEDFTFYDIQPTDYDKKYVKLKSEINKGFDILRDKNIVYTCEHFEELLNNMHDDLPFIVAIMSVPLHKINSDLKQGFWNEYQKLIKSYIDKSKEE